MNITANRMNLQFLLGVPGSQVQIPAFQRPYKWEPEQVDELWEDVTSTLRTGHFMGSLVLSGSEPETKIVIDGQQRLTTLLILLGDIRDRYRALGSDLSGRVHQFLTNAFGEGDRKFKLRSGDANWEVFRDFVLRAPGELGRKSWEQIVQLDKRTIARNERLVDNADRLRKHVDKWLARSGAGDTVSELEKLEQFVMTKLEFVVITVPEVADAFVIFETLNDRGLALSAGDLLKNHLLHKAAQSGSDVETLSDEWEGMLDLLQEADLTRFLRHYLLIHHPRVLKEDVFELFKKTLAGSTPASMMDLLKVMARHYGDFVNPYAIEEGGVRNALKDLETLGATMCYPVLLAARRFPETLGDEAFVELARYCEVLTFRYSTICSKDAKELERAYHRAAKLLWESQGKDLEASKNELRRNMPSAAEFTASFQGQVMGQKYVVNYVMRKLEARLDPEEKITRNSGPVHIEHIMPITPNETWRAGLGARVEEHEGYVNRWGNLTLLGGRKNGRASNKPFQEKKAVYAGSSILLTRQLAELPDWNLEQIDERQRTLGQMAEKVWSMP
jgi:uncharacterized protein with ParB-like and HNH nuclease domain